jgi:hypothetical protein
MTGDDEQDPAGIEETGFTLPESEAKQGGEPPPATSPLIVIEYRQRLIARLMPALLILVAAVAITSYQRRTPIRPLSTHVRPADTQTSGAELAGAERKNAKILVKAIRSEDLARNTSTAAASEPEKPRRDETSAKATQAGPAERPGAAKAERVRSPFELDPADGLEPLEPEIPTETLSPRSALASSPGRQADPTPEAAALEASDPRPAAGTENVAAEKEEPEPTKDDILRDIRNEAAEKRAELQDMEELKPRARALLLGETMAKIQAGREPFHSELRAVLKTMGSLAGPEIERLSEQHGRETPPEVEVAYYRALRSAPNRMSRKDEVELMRSLGLPEPVILDKLCHLLHKTINTRGGPRDPNEVRVRAARLLLSFPIVQGRDTPPAAAALPVSRTATRP